MKLFKFQNFYSSEIAARELCEKQSEALKAYILEINCYPITITDVTLTLIKKENF